jgi:hypothetical protein
MTQGTFLSKLINEHLVKEGKVVLSRYQKEEEQFDMP